MQIFEESDGNVTNYGNFTPVKRQNVRQDVPLLDNLAHKFQNSQNTIQDQINQLKQGKSYSRSMLYLTIYKKCSKNLCNKTLAATKNSA